MGNFFNVVNLLGWVGVISLITYKFFNNPYLYFNQDLTLEIGVLTIVQTLQIFDILLILIGKSKGSLFGSIAQITGRLIVAYIFVQDQTDTYSFSFMAIMWGIADIIRYAYYINKNDATTFVRYHGFLILYPLGVWAEMKVINNYIKRHAAQLTIQQISSIRLVQAGIIIGMVFLYIYMLNSRNKHYGKAALQPKLNNQQKTAQKVQKKLSAKRQ